MTGDGGANLLHNYIIHPLVKKSAEIGNNWGNKINLDRQLENTARTVEETVIIILLLNKYVRTETIFFLRKFRAIVFHIRIYIHTAVS